MARANAADIKPALLHCQCRLGCDRAQVRLQKPLVLTIALFHRITGVGENPKPDFLLDLPSAASGERFDPRSPSATDIAGNNAPASQLEFQLTALSDRRIELRFNAGSRFGDGHAITSRGHFGVTTLA